jgi:hypothetical protein
MTNRNVGWVRILLVGGVVGAAVALGLGANQGRPVGYQIEGRGFILPAAQIISFIDTIGRVDTVTGAVYQLRGDVTTPSSAETWELRVPAVKGSTSGLLEIQRATFNQRDATFLVDVVTGRTWLLNRRGNNNGSWDEVKIYQR